MRLLVKREMQYGGDEQLILALSSERAYFCINVPVCEFFWIQVISWFYSNILVALFYFSWIRKFEPIFTKLLQNYFLCIIILDTCYFVISCTPGMVSPTLNYGSFLVR